MASILKLGLRDFIKDVYNIDVDELCDYDNFYFEPSTNEYTQEELLLAQETFPNLTSESICRLLNDTYNRLYETAYIDEYYDLLTNEIEAKIKKDIPQMIKFFEADLKALKIRGTADDLKFDIDWAKDTITFKGKLSILDGCILQVVNDYGAFGYDGVAGFRYACGNIKGRIAGHLHWLKYTEDIYGTIYNFFRVNTEGLGNYIYPYVVGQINKTSLQEMYAEDFYQAVI